MTALRDAPAAEPGAPEAWLFSLRVQGTRYAFDASLVAEVVRVGLLTRLPSAPGFLLGVFTYRGDVLPALDLAQLLGLSATPARQGVRAAVVRSGPWKVAVVADEVEGLISLPATSIDRPPAEGGGTAEYLTAVGRDGGGTVAVIDLPRLVDAARARSVA